MIDEIIKLKKERDAVILAHTYQPGEVQDIADFVGDSYGLSVEAAKTKADTIIFCGVMFMAETAAILNPGKTVIIPDAGAGCPMADMISEHDLAEMKKSYPSHLVVCYVNSTAKVKALSDICCTSSNAVTIINKIPMETGIIFVPDMHLGSWVQKQCNREMILWKGFCPTHARMTPQMVKNARESYPSAIVLMHPEAPPECRELADKVLSTGGMCSYAKSSPDAEFIIATEEGLIHTLKTQNPEKRFYPLNPPLICPNMKKCSVEKVYKSLNGSGGQVVNVDPEVAVRARKSLEKMLEMSV